MVKTLQIIQGGKVIDTMEWQVPSRSEQGKTYTVRAAIKPNGELTNWYCPCEYRKWNPSCFHESTAQAMRMLEQYAEMNQ